MGEKNRVKVAIEGKVINISGEESEEYLFMVAEYVNSRIKELKYNERLKNLDPGLITALAAVNITDGYFKVLEENRVISKDLEGALNELGSNRERLSVLENKNVSQKNYITRLEKERRMLETAVDNLRKGKRADGREDSLKNPKVSELPEDIQNTGK